MTRARTLARRTDPQSSHLAAREHVASGANASQVQAVVAMVREHPGLTGAELARIGITASGARLDVYQTRRRLTDALNDGLLQHGPERICTVSGRQSLTWEPVPPARTVQGSMWE